MEEKIEQLAANIYAQLVVSEFYKSSAISYEDMQSKAVEAAEFFYK